MRILLSKVLIGILLLTLSSTQNISSTCDLKTYQMLKNPPSRDILTLGNVMLDFFNALNNTDYSNAINVWRKFATYKRTTFMKRFINLTQKAYQVNEIYNELVPIEDTQSFNFQEACIDYCLDTITYTVTKAPTSYAAIQTQETIAKPAAINGTEWCDNPDNMFCWFDIAILGPYNSYMMDDITRYPTMLTADGRYLMVFRRYRNGTVKYCFTEDGLTQLITHACSRYQEFKNAYNNERRLSVFTNEEKVILTDQIDAQLQIDYLYALSQTKFGAELGRLYNDCLRFGPL